MDITRIGVGIVPLVLAVACAVSEDDEEIRPVVIKADSGKPESQFGCVAKTCSQLGYDCGNAPDQCGGTLRCGVCSGGQTCGANGPNRCGSGTCSPIDCAASSSSCGIISDGCANVLECGSCADGAVCSVVNNVGKCSDLGGSGGSSGGSGSGGSGGGNGCDINDFCQANRHDSGSYCDRNDSVTCGKQGSCNKVVTRTSCGTALCSGGVCNESCDTKCRGRCGTFSGCNCGGCLDPWVCVSNVCKECKVGAIDEKDCIITGNYCPPGTQKRICGTDNKWSEFFNCQSSVKYFSDGYKYCKTGQMCLKIKMDDSEKGTLQYLASYHNGQVFDGTEEMVLETVPFSSTVLYGLSPMPGNVEVSVWGAALTWDPAYGDIVHIRVKNTRGAPHNDVVYSGEALLARCRE